MADINQIISLGLGTPADISHLTLFGLSPNNAVNGSLSATLGALTLAGTAQLTTHGALTATLGALTLSAVGGAPTTAVILTLDGSWDPAITLDGSYDSTITLDGSWGN